MLKPTYKPSAAATAPLPPGWTEHKAPTGHPYYYKAETGESTYRRPGLLAVPQPVAPQPATGFHPPQPVIPNLADPHVANAYLAQFRPRPQPHLGGGFQAPPRPQPVDKPRSKEAIPGCEPWILVYTKYSRRFVYNPVNKASFWRIPEKLMPAILELDKARIRAKATGASDEVNATTHAKTEVKQEPQVDQPGDSPDYQEIEVTDEEEESGDDEPGGEHASKRQRTDGPARGAAEEQDARVEFTEADIAAQLQLMGDEYGLEPGDYEHDNTENWPQGTEDADLSIEDAKLLFKDLLDDLDMNPYSPWDKLLEEGKMIDDARYTALSTTRARKECWDEWSRDKIAEQKEQRANQDKKDPKVAYLAFLQEKASPRLYWPEFKRKYRKEEPMKDPKVSDKDREKAYREHINRLKMPQAALKSDLTALLKAQPMHLLHNKSLSSGLPTQVLADIRYISLEPNMRDQLIEAYVQSLPPPPQDPNAAEEEHDRRKGREARERRERALQERIRTVEELKRRREREVAVSKARLREGERELEMAMRVDKRGLQSQLAPEPTDDRGDTLPSQGRSTGEQRGHSPMDE